MSGKWLVVCTALFAMSAGVRPESHIEAARHQAPIGETGKFVLHKLEQAIGEETYKITREGDSVAVKVEFKFTDRGTPVPLNVTLKAAKDLTPSDAPPRSCRMLQELERQKLIRCPTLFAATMPRCRNE